MKLFAVLVSLLALFACGGGGGGSSPTPSPAPTNVDITISGTAATGTAIPGATITAKCQIGTGAATTSGDGTYSLVVKNGKLPCLLQITNPVDGTKLHTVAIGSGVSVIANITPLTEMVVARVLRNDPVIFFAAFDAIVAASTITVVTVGAAQTDVSAVLVGTVDTSSLGSFISTSLRAATAGNLTSGDAQDKLLDTLRTKFNPGQLTQVVSALAKTSNVADIKQGLANLSAAPPTANAGPDQDVVTGTLVILDGSASTVASTRALTYSWSLTTKPVGSSAIIALPTSIKPTFIADFSGTYVASLIVNDGVTNSSGDAVSITASTTNSAPVANAGISKDVVTGAVVTLDGSGSSDANGDPLTYAWTLTAKPAASTASLSQTTSSKPTFSADIAGTYIVSLVVNDGKINSKVATVLITATLPIAQVNLKEEIGLVGLSSNAMVTQVITDAVGVINNVIVNANCDLAASLTAVVNINGQSHNLQASGRATLYNYATAIDCNYLFNSSTIFISTAQVSGSGSINGPQIASNFQGQFDISGSSGYLISASLLSGINFSDFFIINGAGRMTNINSAGHQYPSVTGSVNNVRLSVLDAINFLEQAQSGKGVTLGNIARAVKSGDVYAQSSNCADIRIHFNGTNLIDLYSSCTVPNHFMVDVDTAAIIE